MTSKKWILLLDIDGVLIDSQQLWRQINQKFLEKFPQQNLNTFHQLYDKYQDKDRNLRFQKMIIEGINLFGKDFWQVFYEIDFKSCFRTTSWERIQKLSMDYPLEIHIFSEGITQPITEIKEIISPYQLHKIDSLELNLDSNLIHVSEDKIKFFKENKTVFDKTNIIYVDNDLQVLEKFHLIEPQGQLFWVQRLSQDNIPSWLAGHAFNMDEIIDMIKLILEKEI